MKLATFLLAVAITVCLALGAEAQGMGQGPGGGGPPGQQGPGNGNPNQGGGNPNQGGGNPNSGSNPNGGSNNQPSSGSPSSSSPSSSSSQPSSSSSSPSSGGNQPSGGSNNSGGMKPPMKQNPKGPPPKTPDPKTNAPKNNVPQEERRCDMCRVVRGKYCALEGKVLGKDDVTRNAEKEEICKSCMAKPEETLICVKKMWMCNFGDKLVRREQPRTPCPKCQTSKWELAEESRCVIVYECEGCRTWWLKDRACDTTGCKKKGVRARKKCRLSGELPHVQEQ